MMIDEIEELYYGTMSRCWCYVLTIQLMTDVPDFVVVFNISPISHTDVTSLLK